MGGCEGRGDFGGNLKPARALMLKRRGDHCRRKPLIITFEVSNRDKQTTFTMADDDHDYTIENADAGASETIPMEAGQIKKGG